MKIGQPFYRINQNYLLSTFNEHKFSVVFVLGIEQNASNNVVLECFASDLTVSESLTANRASNGYNVPLEYDADAFSKLSDSEQNSVFFDQFGFVANPEDLRSQFNTQVETEIQKERDRIQQWSNKLDEIEESIDNPTEDFLAFVVNQPPIHIGIIELKSTFFGVDVTNETVFYINNNRISGNQFDTKVIGLHNAKAEYKSNEKVFSFEVVPTP